MKKTIKTIISTTLACLLLANVIVTGNAVNNVDNSGSASTHTIIDLGEIN